MRKLRPALAVLIISGWSLSPLCAQTETAISDKRPATHADIWLMKRPQRPVLSPDGKWVVVSVEEPAYNPQAEHRDLWLLAVEGNFAPRRITAERAGQTGVEWSPVGLKIAFSSRRGEDEKPQIYALDLSAGGEAVRLTNMPGGARSPHWSPDGSKVLFTSDVAPENRDAPQIVKPGAVRAYERSPVRVGDRWLDNRRPRLFVQEAAPGAVPVDLLASTPFANSAVWRGLLNGKTEDLPATWTPDGTGIVFVGCVNADALLYSKPDTELFLVSARGGEATRLTQSAAQYGLPQFTRDGHAMVVRVTQQAESGYHLPKLMRYAWPWVAGDGTALTAGFDRAASDPTLAGNDGKVFFTADDAGTDKLYFAPLEGGTAPIELAAGTGSAAFVSGNRFRTGSVVQLVTVQSSTALAPEVYVWEEKDAKVVPRRISDFNTAREAGLDLPAAESIVTKTMDGEQVQSWLFRPAQFDGAKKYPVVVLIHDGPHDTARVAFAATLNPHLLAGNKYLVLETNYRGSVGFGEAFAQSLEKNPVQGPAEDVMDALNDVLQNDGFADGNRVAVIASGYGGLVANWLQATSTRFRSFVLQGGAADPKALWATTDHNFDRETIFGGPTWEQSALWREQNPVALAGNHAAGTGWLTPTLLAVGEKDFRAPINATLENWTYLQRLKVPSRLLVFPEEGHELKSGENDRYFMHEAQAWLAQWFESGK